MRVSEVELTGIVMSKCANKIDGDQTAYINCTVLVN